MIQRDASVFISCSTSVGYEAKAALVQCCASVWSAGQTRAWYGMYSVCGPVCPRMKEQKFGLIGAKKVDNTS